MSRQKLMTSAGLVTALCIGYSGVTSARDDSNVVYKGDNTARAVCMSIVEDSVPLLRHALNSASRSAYTNSRTIDQSFNCNDQPLDQFAMSQDADQVMGYLEDRYGYPHARITSEQVSSIND
jgi:hypothetical protein